MAEIKQLVPCSAALYAEFRGVGEQRVIALALMDTGDIWPVVADDSDGLCVRNVLAAGAGFDGFRVNEPNYSQDTRERSLIKIAERLDDLAEFVDDCTIVDSYGGRFLRTCRNNY